MFLNFYYAFLLQLFAQEAVIMAGSVLVIIDVNVLLAIQAGTAIEVSETFL